MKERLLGFLKILFFWISFFILSKLLFLLYQFRLSSQLSISDLFNVFLHGLKHDFSATGYIMMLIGFIFSISSFLNGKYWYKIANSLVFIILVLSSIIIITDLELYRNWGFRMDSTPLLYLKTPKEAFASIELWLLILLIVGGFVWGLGFWLIYKKIIGSKLKNIKASNWKTCCWFILISAIMIIPIRGSISIAPMNVGAVYFHSTNNFANHAAINVVWNFVYSLVQPEIDVKSYQYMEDKEANQVFDNLYKKEEGITNYLVKNQKTNVIIIILESFTSKIIEPLGGLKGITPNFTKLSKEGILFDHFYASGDRSDKGIVSILSGYPAQPTTSIIKYSKKVQTLNFLIRDFKKEGYNSAFYYGGDANFANMRSYLINSGFDKIISKNDFSILQTTSKWGAHDHIVFNKLIEDLDKAKEPFINVCFTLSNHEPFEVPMNTFIKGTDEDSKFLNSTYYADKSLGEFIETAKTKSWWNNTLIILVADHGVRYPGNTPMHFYVKFQIPMLWLGGAITIKDTIINTIGSQTDIAQTLLSQFNIKAAHYKFSKNLLNKTINPYAVYVFNDGFGYITPNCISIFDNNKKQYIEVYGNQIESDKKAGMSYIQVLMDDFSKR